MMTMQNIAELSGCARSTVYAVLNNKPWVSEKTRKKVMDVVNKYGWTPDRMAAGLVGGATNLIALILKDVLNPFNSQIVAGINSVLRRVGYNTLLLSTMDEHNLEVEAVTMARSYRVDGIIMTPQQVGVDFSHLWKLKEAGEICVTFGCCPGIGFSYIEMDEARSVEKIVRHLAELGHRRIGFLRGPRTSLSAGQRLEGFRNGIMTNRLDFGAELLGSGGATLKEGYEGALELLDRSEGRPTALICYNDLSAAGAYRAAAERGLSVPGDLSITGFDDIELASVFGPPLTTVRQPCFDMGRWMAGRVLEEIRLRREGQVPEPVSELFSGELVSRGSSSAPREVVL